MKTLRLVISQTNEKFSRKTKFQKVLQENGVEGVKSHSIP